MDIDTDVNLILNKVAFERCFLELPPSWSVLSIFLHDQYFIILKAWFYQNICSQENKGNNYSFILMRRCERYINKSSILLCKSNKLCCYINTHQMEDGIHQEQLLWGIVGTWVENVRNELVVCDEEHSLHAVQPLPGTKTNNTICLTLANHTIDCKWRCHCIWKLLII